MRHLKILLPGAIAAIVLVGLSIYYPLWRSESWQRQYLLTLTPLGSSMGAVEAKIREKGYEIRYISRTAGLDPSEVGDQSKLGVKSIRAYAGEYYGSLPYLIFPTSVTYFWSFDKDEHLVDVWVGKDIDAL